MNDAHLCRVPTVFRTWWSPGGWRDLEGFRLPLLGGSCSLPSPTAPVSFMRLRLAPCITNRVGTIMCTVSPAGQSSLAESEATRQVQRSELAGNLGRLLRGPR